MTADWITPQTMIPDLLGRAPEARRVLDRYGLHGCGGALGPAESLHFFAQAHEVPLERLLAELHEALSGAAPPASAATTDAGASPADTIYQPFFKAGIAVVLTLGALWGALLLIRIALHGSFMALDVHEVNAHGHAQIFGWVGLFVMGFAYQAFPRFKHTTLAWPRLAVATFWWMVIGIAARSILEPLAGRSTWLQGIALGGGVIEIVAIACFSAIIVATLRRSGKPLAHYDYYILAALFFFVIQAAYETVYFAATLWATTRETLVPLVGVWQAPLRDLQIHGFAMLMILGVSQRLFHHFYGFPEPQPARSLACLGVLVAAVAGEVAGLILMRTAGHAWAGLWFGSVALLLAAAAFLVRGWHIFGPHDEPADRSLKFLRAAYVWLFVALAMLVLLPVYQFGLLPALAPESDSARIGFSHAYYGATRHAITVGFVSLMIVGVAAKVVPTLKGVDVRGLSALWAPFLLLNLGCALRVAGQTLTDFSPRVFPLTGASGLLEVAGLAIWGTHLWRIMRRRDGAHEEEPARERLTPQTPILPAHRVADVLEACPWLLETFIAYGFTPLANPALRATLARGVSIRMACRIHTTDLERFVKSLNEARLAGSEPTARA